MIKFFSATDAIEDVARRINELLDAHHEWFISAQDGNLRSNALRRAEIDVAVVHGRLILSYWSDAGALLWRVIGWEWTNDKLLLDATRDMNRTRVVLELIPRASAKAIAATVSATRRTLCERLAHLAAQESPNTQLESARLSAGVRRNEPGRYARVVLLSRLRNERIAVTGSVVKLSAGDADAFLSSSLLWFLRACEKAQKPPVQKLWLIAGRECLAAIKQRVALLRDDLRGRISLYEMDDGWQQLTLVPQLEPDELWPEMRVRVRRPTLNNWISGAAKEIIALAPDAIDVVRAGHGETLRYHGLAFARVRRLMKDERVWFGVERARRQLLCEATRDEWRKLLQELKEHRRAGASDHRHALYRVAPEAWLESMLRRDITRLDPGLVIAPLHAQFRATQTGAQGDDSVDRNGTARPVDLLALRRDGRLAVIELKVNEDREIVFQGADYFRRVEAYRRSGYITHAKLFGEATIADEPPLVFLVAPTLRFHRAFNTLAATVTPDIELYRFDINEDWRAGVRVARRLRVN